jgi:hypothetical protein
MMTRYALTKGVGAPPGRTAEFASMTELVFGRLRRSARGDMAALYRSAATHATAQGRSGSTLAA